jgi:hypothetical protein
MAVKKTLSGLIVGTYWKDTYGNTYEITGFYTIKGHNHYHVKVNGKYLIEGRNSTRLVPEDEVREMRANKV